MEMTLRWYGPGYDSVTLKQIRQIPGVKNVITTLFGKQAGELWLPKEIAELKKIVNDAGLGIAGIESVNVSDDIKIGTAKRDEHIDNYIKTLQALGEADIHMVCYNFMPVFDWTRTELARVRPDGSTVLAYNQDTVDMIDPEHMRESVEKMSNGFVMPGWEPERLDRLKELFEMYRDVDAEKLFDNLVYFLEAIGPSSLSNTGSPIPGIIPSTTHSMIPPIESPSCIFCVAYASTFAAASLSGIVNAFSRAACRSNFS